MKTLLFFNVTKMDKIRLTVILLICTLSLSAQNLSKQEKLERIKAQKIAFITNRLQLTTNEAQKFWPVYNEFFAKKEQLNKEKKQVNLDLKNNWKNYPDSKKTELIDQLVSFKLKDAELQMEFHNQLKKILPIDKVILLHQVESQFKTYLLKQLKGQANGEINPSSRNFKRK